MSIQDVSNLTKVSVDAVTAASAAQRTAVPRTHVTELLITAA